MKKKFFYFYKNIKNFIKKFIEDNKDRNLNYVKDYKE